MNKSTKPMFFLSAMAKMSAIASAIQSNHSEVPLLQALPVREKAKRSAYKHSGVAKAKRAAKKARNVKRAKHQ